MDFERDITVNGVQLRLHKLDAFEQYEMTEKLYPLVVEALMTYTSKAKSMSPEAFAGLLGAQVLKSLSAQDRRSLIFDHLLSKRSVQVVINGMEMPLIGKTESGGSAIMHQELADFSDLLEVALEAFKFNFERFFTKLQKFMPQKP